MTSTTTRQVRGSDLAIGDQVVLLNDTHRLDAFIPYEGALLETLGEGTRIGIAVVRDGSWSITLPPAMTFTVLN